MLCDGSKFKIIDTGLDHGTITILGKKKYEITTLRKDVKTDGRHAIVDYTDDWQEDSNRRDFTFNAIYLKKNGKVFDPQSGVSDLKKALKGNDIEDVKKKTQNLIQVSMKLGEAVYKSQQKDQPKDDKKDPNDKGKDKENVVDADFEDVKEDKEKSA